MRLAIVLMLLFVAQDLYAQVPQPVPRKTAKGSTHTSKQVQNQAAPDKQISAPNQIPVDQNASQKEKNGGNPERADNTQKPIRVTELPPVSVTKDWTDRAYWIFSGLLVVVGALQGGLLFATLIAMGRQTTFIRDSASAATKSADAAINTVRTMQDNGEKQLRAYVYPVAASRIVDGIHAPLFRLQIKNSGQTPAYDCSRYAVEVFSSTFPLAPEGFNPVPGNPPSKSPIPPGEFVEIVATAHPLTSQQQEQITLSRAAIYLYGKINYRDAFGHDRESTFRFVCVGDNFVRGLFAACDEGNTAN
jgi:hypothetical protein